MTDKVFLIIVNWNGCKNTLECLNSLEKLPAVSYELSVVVVDNGSSDDSVRAIRENYPKTIVIPNKENLGFAEGNNIGIKYGLKNNASYIMLLNNDTLAEKNLIEEFLKVFKKDEKIGILAPKIYFASGFEFHKKRYKEEEKGKVFWYAGGTIDWKNIYGCHRGVDEVDRGQYDIIRETEFASGCGMMVKREVFERIGFLDSNYYLYYEDSDFCLRAKKAGFKIIYVPAAIIWHKNAESSGGSGGNLQDYYITRNRLYFGTKYASLRTKMALWRQAAKLLFSSSAKRQGVIDFFLGRFGRGSYD